MANSNSNNLDATLEQIAENVDAIARFVGRSAELQLQTQMKLDQTQSKIDQLAEYIAQLTSANETSPTC